MTFPDDLEYTPEHEWVRDLGDGTFRLGLTSYAQEALGEVVLVSLPGVGTDVHAGEPLGEVESVQSVADLFAPVTGRVTARNRALSASPELVNTDPYGEGWLVEIVGEAGAGVALLSGAEYQQRVHAA